MNILTLAKQTKALAEKATPGPGRCQRCGEVLPRGEEMFLYHGYSGNCPIWHPKPAFDVNLAIAAPQLADAVVSLHSTVAALQDENDALRECVRYVALGPNSEQAARCRELLTRLEGE